jgi:hypothetical protein
MRLLKYYYIRQELLFLHCNCSLHSNDWLNTPVCVLIMEEISRSLTADVALLIRGSKYKNCIMDNQKFKLLWPSLHRSGSHNQHKFRNRLDLHYISRLNLSSGFFFATEKLNNLSRYGSFNLLRCTAFCILYSKWFRCSLAGFLYLCPNGSSMHGLSEPEIHLCPGVHLCPRFIYGGLYCTRGLSKTNLFVPATHLFPFYLCQRFIYARFICIHMVLPSYHDLL